MTWLAVAVLVGDLFLAHGSFNPAAATRRCRRCALRHAARGQLYCRRVNSGLPSPQAGEPLDLWRFTTFNVPGEKTFNANVGMYYGWQDIRGYDSIIPRQYVELMERIPPQDDELLYNRIAPLYANQGGDVYAVLDNPLLDLLNVKYILTEHYIPNPTWQEIYRDDGDRRL